MKMISGTLVEDSNLVALSVALGHAEIKLRAEYPEIAKEIVDALVKAISGADKIMISRMEAK